MNKLPIILAALLALCAPAYPQAAKKLTNRQFPDGTGSSRETDPEKREAVETFYDTAGKTAYSIRYKLDNRLQPISGIYYNKLGKVFQKSAYKLDGQDRIIQEVVYDPQDRLVCTKNYEYGARTRMVQGRPVTSAIVEKVYIYNAKGELTNVEKSGSKGLPKRR